MLKAGAAVLDITPPLGTALAGSFTARYATGVDDPLHARAVVLEDDQGPTGRVALVCCDLICMPGETVRTARDLAAEWAGVPPDRILIAATHTHTAASPTGLLGTPRADAYMDALPARIATAIALAAQRLRPARAAWGSGSIHGVTFNRRFHMKDGTVRMNPGRRSPDAVKPAGPIDPELGVLWLESEDGAPIASVASFSLHYIGTDHANHVSADYFGHYARWMQRTYGHLGQSGQVGPDYVPLLFNAASGDINGVDVSDPDPLAGYAKARRVAAIVGAETVNVVQRLRPTADVTLAAASTRFSFRRKTITAEDLAVSDRILAVPDSVPNQDLRHHLGLGNTGPFSWIVGQPMPDYGLRQYARECQLLAALPEQQETELQAIRVGDCAIASLPGEIFVQLGMAVKQASLFRSDAQASAASASGGSPPTATTGVTLIASLANDYVGYVATRRAIAEEGSYETWAARSSLPAPGEGERMVAAAAALLQEV